MDMNKRGRQSVEQIDKQNDRTTGIQKCRQKADRNQKTRNTQTHAARRTVKETNIQTKQLE